ncbi:hypothetical protein R3P38DRAFT_2777265 [Favolaschia claudopus]|uniref:Uncharacterized protein n=1 Tax=Favolaschia claudopus TaxID=2862362 RepID=A0AAW0BLA3_9AGAR
MTRHDNFSSIGARERLLMAPSAYSVDPTPIPSSSAYCVATDGNLRHLQSAAAAVRPLGAHILKILSLYMQHKIQRDREKGPIKTDTHIAKRMDSIQQQPTPGNPPVHA